MAKEALLALTVVLVWSLVGLEVAAPRVHAAGPATDNHHSHAEGNDQRRGLLVTMNADCMANGCCAMAHCHPGISVDPHEPTAIVASDDTATSAAERGSGRAPGVILPPPRPSAL